MKKITEFSIQRDIFTWASLNYKKYPGLDLMYATASGIKLSWGQIVKAKMTGIVKKGLPDICLPVARKGLAGLYIELKTQKGRASPEQMEYIDRLAKEGYLAVIVYGFNQAIKTIEEYYE